MKLMKLEEKHTRLIFSKKRWPTVITTMRRSYSCEEPTEIDEDLLKSIFPKLSLYDKITVYHECPKDFANSRNKTILVHDLMTPKYKKCKKCKEILTEISIVESKRMKTSIKLIYGYNY